MNKTPNQSLIQLDATARSILESMMLASKKTVFNLDKQPVVSVVPDHVGTLQHLRNIHLGKL